MNFFRIGASLSAVSALIALAGCGQANETDSSVNSVHRDTWAESAIRDESAASRDRNPGMPDRNPRPGHPGGPGHGPVQPLPPGGPGSGPVQPYPPQPYPPQPYPPQPQPQPWPQPQPQPQPWPQPQPQPQPWPQPNPQPYPPPYPYPTPGYGLITQLDICLAAEGVPVCTTINAHGYVNFSPDTRGDYNRDISNLAISVRASSNPGQQPITSLSLCLRNSAGQAGCTVSAGADYSYHGSQLMGREPWAQNINGISVGGSAQGGWGAGMRVINVCISAEDRGITCAGEARADGMVHHSPITFGDGARDIISASIGFSAGQ